MNRSELLYHYKATVNRVVDGDTVNLTIDLGFSTHWKSNCRLAGIDTPEIKGVDEATKAQGGKAKQFVLDKLIPVLGKPADVLIKSTHLDKYGRPVVILYYGDNFEYNLNQELVDRGLAEAIK